MPDRLYAAIEDAITKPLNGDLFERCAVDLLREYYPTLRPVEGGADAGMDGVGELADGERFFLVATTARDARSNLDRNIQSHLDAGGDRRSVVFATSRKVSGQRQVELSNHLMQQFGVRLAEVHDRANFVRLIYRNPQWRKDLLSVPAQSKALTRLPVTRRPVPDIPLIGRNDDLEQLRSVKGDLVIVGKPGIGKTFLLEKLMDEHWGLFDDGWPVADLEDAIRELSPRRVVLDDAQLKEERIAVLRQLRRAMNVDFDIVAVSWPGQQADVAAALVGSSSFEARELDRDQILRIVQEVGVMGPRELQAILVNQSLGRAGLAVTLAHACVTGHVRDVAAGDALLTDIVGWFTRSIGRESRHVLGILALAGNSGATLGQVARILGLDVARVSDVVSGLASGGTVDEAPRREQVTRLRVQPESLRYALVRDVFFGGVGSIDLSPALAELDHPSVALLPLVGAAHRGASIDRGFLLGLADLDSSEAVTAFALLGPSETREALRVAPQHRASIARAAYESGISPEDNLRLLMELAVGDRREEHNSPDHPLRIVGDYLTGAAGTIEARRLAVSVADKWLKEGGDTDVGFRVLMHALEPRVRMVYSDPGAGNTVTISEAALPSSSVEELGQLWDSVLEIVPRQRAASYAPVIRALHSWVFPGTLGFGRGPDEATANTIRDVATRVISSLANLLSERPGALHELRDYAIRGGLAVSVNVPAEFAVLFPADWDGREGDGGYDGWARRADVAVRELATTLQQLPIGELAARITAADREALDAGISYPRLTPNLAQLLAAEAPKPELYLDALEQLDASGDVLMPFVDRVVELRRDGWEASLERLLNVDRTAWLATYVVLRHSVGPRLKDLAIQRMTPAYSNLTNVIIARDEADPDTIERLLNAPNQLVARDVAVAIGQSASDTVLSRLSDAARKRWRQVIVNSPADDYWYSVILQRDPDLFADWLRAWFQRIENDANPEFLPHTLEEAIEQLPAAVRADLLRAIPSGTRSFFFQGALTRLISSDLEVAAVLFEREDLKDMRWAALRDGPSEAWLKRAMMALDRGWEPEQIVAQTMFAQSVWSGDESLHWQEKTRAFESLRSVGEPVDQRRESIIDAGVHYFEKHRAAAADQERRERVFGYDRK